MVHTTVDGTFRKTNLTNESSEYPAKREQLRHAEIELMRQRERVAELRRHLPQGAPVQDYQFEEGPSDLNAGDAPVRTVRLSELFTKPNRSLIIYHLMYGKLQAKPCPMCTAWIDGANGVAHHLAQISISPLSRPLIFQLCATTRVREAGTSYVCSAPAATLSSMTWAAKTAKGIKTRRFPFSRATLTATCATSTPRILEWLRTSPNRASTCSLPYGTSWSSRRKAAATGTRASTMAPKSKPPAHSS